jgi:hypothetical protein
MPDATHFARQWAGIVAQVRLFGANAPRATLIEAGGRVASVMPAVPTSSLMNVALAVDPAEPPHNLEQLAERFREARATKWGLWVDGGEERAALAAQEQGMVLDSRPAARVASLSELPFDEAPEPQRPDLPTVGLIDDLAYGYPEAKLAPAIANLPDTVLTDGARHDGEVASVAMAHARERGQETASLKASQAGRPLCERLGFASVGELHLYEERFG